MVEETEQTHQQCLDCELWSQGPFCNYCGQKMDLSSSIGEFLLQALPSIASRDGRFTRTFKMLLFNPGRLTRRFHAGKRTRYLSPIGMLLSAIFILFMLPLVTGLIPENAEEQRQFQATNRSTMLELDAGIKKLEQQVNQAKGERRVELLEELSSDIYLRNTVARIADVPTIPKSRHAKLLKELHSPDENWIERRFSIIGQEWSKNPELKLTSLRNTLIKYSWLLIPLTLPTMMLLMPGGHRNRFKHVLFAGYSLAFMLFLIALLLSAMMFEIDAVLLVSSVILIALVHLFIQTKNAYRLPWLAAFGHYFAILFCAVFGLILFVTLLFVLNLI